MVLSTYVQGVKKKDGVQEAMPVWLVCGVARPSGAEMVSPF